MGCEKPVYISRGVPNIGVTLIVESTESSVIQCTNCRTGNGVWELFSSILQIRVWMWTDYVCLSL